MNLRIACVTALFACAACGAEKPAVDGAQPGRWTMDFDAAKKTAAEKKLPLLLNFTGSDWCGWCKLMDKEVFAKTAWAGYAKENLLLVWIDFPNDKSLVPQKYVARNQELQKVFGVEGFPAYILLDDDGKTELGRLGASRETTAESFIAEINELAQARAAAVESLLKSLPEKTAQEYRETAKALAQAQQALAAAQAVYEKASTELGGQIAKQEKRLADIRLDARLAKLPAKEAATYREKKTRYEAVETELKAWLETGPERNEANTKKFTAWREQMEQLEKEMRGLLK